MGMFADMAEQHPLLSMSTRFVDHSQFTIKERARLLSTDVLISGWVRDYAASRFVPRVCAWGVCVNLSICLADADHQGDLFYQSNSWTPDYSGMPVAYDWAVANGPPMPTRDLRPEIGLDRAVDLAAAADLATVWWHLPCERATVV